MFLSENLCFCLTDIFESANLSVNYFEEGAPKALWQLIHNNRVSPILPPTVFFLCY